MRATLHFFVASLSIAVGIRSPAAPLAAEPTRAPRAIPDRLVLNHRWKFLEYQTEDEQAGVDSARARKHQRMAGVLNETQSVMHFETVELMDDKGCIDIIERAHSKELAEAFVAERSGPFKSDICRLAQLYEDGGYYFDNDMQAKQDLRDFVPPNTSFVSCVAFWTSWSRPGHPGKVDAERAFLKDQLFNSLIGVAPRHPLIQHAMNRTLSYYKADKSNQSAKYNGDPGPLFYMGPWLLREAYEWWAGLANLGGGMQVGATHHANRDSFQDSYLFNETDEVENFKPRMRRRREFIGDGPSKQVVFLSRINGI